MPIFDFFCNNCNKTFERFVFSLKDIDGVQCPLCGSKDIKKMLSGFSRGSTGVSSGKNSAGAMCGGSAGISGRRFG